MTSPEKGPESGPRPWARALEDYKAVITQQLCQNGYQALRALSAPSDGGPHPKQARSWSDNDVLVYQAAGRLALEACRHLHVSDDGTTLGNSGEDTII